MHNAHGAQVSPKLKKVSNSAFAKWTYISTYNHSVYMPLYSAVGLGYFPLIQGPLKPNTCTKKHMLDLNKILLKKKKIYFIIQAKNPLAR